MWDHIKNHGDHGAENYELDWVGTVSGMRESRRMMGDYILTENDILSNNERDDGVAYGGWPMDEHVAGGFWAKGGIPSRVRSFPGLYAIPYGCYCAKTIKNLMVTGRIISASKLAMGSTRVMGTCAIGGQAAGTAAAMASRAHLEPSEFGRRHIQELRQELLKDDCYLLGAKNEDPRDIARTATVSATSEKPGCEAAKVINGVSRAVGGESNMWSSDGIRPDGEELSLSFLPHRVSQIRLTFDPNLSEERCISVSKAFLEKEPKGVAKELVKDYTLTLYRDGRPVYAKALSGNYLRLCVTDLEAPVEADRLVVKVLSTNGIADAHIFEVRIY